MEMEALKIIKIIQKEPFEKGSPDEQFTKPKDGPKDRYRGWTPTTFSAEVVFPSENRYAVTVNNPFLEPGVIETDQEERLRWYFEEHMQSPFTEIERRKRAEQSIVYYGEALFNQLFADTDALLEWRSLVAGLDKIQFQVISTDPGFHALHWEALKDPKSSKPLCLQGIDMIHTSGKPVLPYPEAKSACLNLLMVTARPFGKRDIEYRTITRPVVEMIKSKRLRVEVHLLRPPTFRHLQEHLREKKGFYHIVHLDLHGGVMSFDDYQDHFSGEEGKDAGLTSFVKRRSGGRRELGPYTGTKAFIYLVDEEGGPDPVTADETAELLHDAHVPICFLDACRSAMMTVKEKEEKGEKEGQAQDQAQEASLAMALLEKGVKLVPGNAWSVTVTGAKLMMTEVYRQLLEEEEIIKSLNSGRQKMFEDRERAVGGENRLELEDWLLPVIWGKGDFNIRLKTEGVEERIAVQKREQEWESGTQAMKTSGTYGFMGRDVDILQVESLLHRDNILLIRGMGGTGKTILLGHMAHWWWKTGWIDYAFYFGYDRKPYRAEEILNRVAEAVMPREGFGCFLVMPSLAMKVGELAAFLKESKTTPRVLLILDNLESITGAEKAVGSRLSPEDQKDLVLVLRRLLDSSMKILLGSRSDEAWLAKDTFKKNIYWLEGLDKRSRFALAREILKKNRIEVGDWEELRRLLEILAGYPLAMEIILPNLALRTAQELRELLTGEGVDLQSRHGGQISEEIFKCINISFSLLTDQARSALLAFAPFTSFLDTVLLERYLEALHGEGLYQETTLAHLEEALAQAETQGLVKEAEIEKCYALQPVFPFFLWQQVMMAEEGQDREGTSALENAFCHYMSMLAQLYQSLMQSKESVERQKGQYLFRHDRENLHKALNRVLAGQGDFFALYFVFATYYHQNTEYHEAIAWMEDVAGKLDDYADEKRDVEFLGKYASVVGNLGSQYAKIKDYFHAKEKLRKALELCEQAGLRQEMAAGYHQLGMVAQEERDFAEAKRCYGEALKICQELNSRYDQARINHQLGMIAEDERDFAEAKRCYGEALKIFQEFNDRYSHSAVYHQLGNIAFKEGDFTEAKRCYEETLKLNQEFNDRFAQARTYHELGRVTQEETDFPEALRFLALALEILLQYHDEYKVGIAKRNLGRLFTDWDPPTGAIEGLECSDQVKEILKAILEEIRK